ncbi:UNVERIFIED_CONTAM: hypothetical protein HDU68_003424 [Siphonaria sp. JEL0065]|nr:hypothetical protein HDU68_003424 [Siphonaria sp. JEL0065]
MTSLRSSLTKRDELKPSESDCAGIVRSASRNSTTISRVMFSTIEESLRQLPDPIHQDIGNQSKEELYPPQSPNPLKTGLLSLLKGLIPKSQVLGPDNASMKRSMSAEVDIPPSPLEASQELKARSRRKSTAFEKSPQTACSRRQSLTMEDYQPRFSFTRRSSQSSQVDLKIPTISQQTSNKSSMDSHLEFEDSHTAVFSPTIFEVATRAGKNGIPDIVVQCVEYLHRKNLLKTEGLYRVPGSVKRVRTWFQRFEAHYKSHVPSVSLHRSSKARTKRSSLASSGSTNSLEWMATNQRQSIESRKLKVTSSTVVGDTSDSSIAAASGSNPNLRNEENTQVKPPTIKTSSTSSVDKSIISLAFVETKRGVGLWDGEGLYSTIGFSVNLDNETAATVASVLKKFLGTIKGGFATKNLWEVLDKMALDTKNQAPNAQTVLRIREHIQMTLHSPHHVHTLAYLFQHLQQVASFADVNLMTPKNLVTCIFIDAQEGAEYLIRYADIIFGNVDLVGRDVVENLPCEVLESDIPLTADCEPERDRTDQWLRNHISYTSTQVGTSSNSKRTEDPLT